MFTNFNSKIIKNGGKSSPNVKLTSDEVKAITADIPLYEAAAEYMVIQGYWTVTDAGEKI